VYFTKCVLALERKLAETSKDGDSKMAYEEMLNRFIDEWQKSCWIPSFLLPGEMCMDEVVIRADRLLWNELKSQIAADSINENIKNITYEESHKTMNQTSCTELIHFLRDKVNAVKEADDIVDDNEAKEMWSALSVEEVDQCRTEYAKWKLKYEIAHF